ncbi:hypothetical protein VZT92_000299 [Zoarces viviparus]|uniref:Secreted protein n=1 Tax=Zoarces viviparus TaxID=48416 RepID=A0AAW1G5G3_ZOAVI
MPFHAVFIFLWFSSCFLWKMDPVCGVYTAGWKTRAPDSSPSCPSPPSPLSYWEVFHEQLGPGRGEKDVISAATSV